MKTFKKFLICILSIIILGIICSNNSYGLVTVDNVFSIKIKNMLGDHIDQNGKWEENGWNSCTQANQDKGYASRIVSVYDVIYNKSKGRIVANSVGQESGAKTFSKVDNVKARTLAAALSVDYNVQGVRDALMKCVRSGILTNSPTLLSNNNDGSAYSGSSDAWESENKAIKDSYENYQALKVVRNGIAKTITDEELTIGDSKIAYKKIGPFRMKYGSAKIKDYLINGQSITGASGKNKVRFQYYDGSKWVMAKYANITVKDKKGNDVASGCKFIMSEKDFYIYVKKSLFNKMVGESSTVEVKFVQNGYSYTRARAIICNDWDGVKQGNIWYAQKSASISKKSVSYKIGYDNAGSIKVVKKDAVSTTAVAGVQIKLYGKVGDNVGWVDDNGDLTTEYDDASILTTGEDGSVTFENVQNGSYYVYEADLPDNYDIEDQRQIYPDSEDTYGFAGKDAYDNMVYLGTVDADGTAKEVTYNQYPLGSLTVQKVVGETGLQGIGIRLYAHTSNGWGWVAGDGTLRPSYYEGNLFVTGSDGKTTATNLRRGTYYIYEYSVPEPYHIEEQRILYPNWNDPLKIAGNAGYGNCVYIGSATSSSNATEIKLEQRQTPVKTIQVSKQDKITGQKIQGAGFKILQKLSRYIVQDGVTYNAGTYVWLKSDGKITTNVAEASEIQSDANGSASIGNIRSLGQCFVYEVRTATGYEMEDQSGYMEGKPGDYGGTFLSGTWAYMGTVSLNQNTDLTPTLTLTAINQKTRGNLEIIKRDESYEDEFVNGGVYALAGATLKLYGVDENGSRGWVKPGSTTSTGEVKYNLGSYSEATEFTTGSDGHVLIKNLKFGTYYIYETKTPKGYDIKLQDGYHTQKTGSSEITDTHWAYLGEKKVEYQSNGNGQYTIVYNKKYTTVEGKVWVDMPDNKTYERDHLYKVRSEDRRLGGIEVNLYDYYTKKVIGTAVTGSDGKYSITRDTSGRKLSYWKLSHCYVEFKYNNTRYITVIPFKDGKNMIEYNSKAQEKEITSEDLDDSLLTGRKGRNPGRAVTYTGTNMYNIDRYLISNNRGAAVEKRFLTGYYNDTTCTIENINLGLIQKVNPDHNVAETIEYVKLVKGSYTFTYKYGDEAVTEQGTKQSTVAFGNVNTATFTQGLYPSDIKYNIANGLNGNSNNAFKVYVVYKVTVYNNTNVSSEYVYTERKLNLQSLTNTYDTTKYELSKDVLTGDDPTYTNDFRNWTNSGDTATYNLKDTNKKFKDGLEGGGSEIAYIQFKVKDNALRSVLDGDLNIATTVKATGYHTYTRKDQNWKVKDKVYTHRSNVKTKQSSNLSIKLTLFDTRTISGTVFEDSAIQEKLNNGNELIGNGKYDGTEKTLTEENDASSNKYSVIVSLINAQSVDGEQAGDIAYLYEDDLEQNPASGKWTRSKQRAVTRIDENGNYSFKGVVPGNYYIQFTYGDGRVETKDVYGNTISDAEIATKIKGQSDVINSNYYKSTIITGPVLNAEGNSKWYLDVIDNGIYSVATDSIGTYFDKNGNALNNGQNIDIIDARITSDREINNTTSQDKVVIKAVSPSMDVAFEFLQENEYQVTNNQLRGLKSNCTGMGFGIIERPHVDIRLEETIKNVKLTLQNGTNLINGNPSDQNVSQYLTTIGSSAHARIEIEEKNLYGSSVTVTYKIEAINDSNLNYASKEYYTKGNKEGDIISTTINKMINYASNKNCNYQTPETNDKLTFSDNYGDKGYTKEDYFEDGVISENSKYKNQLLVALEELTPGSRAEFTVRISKLIPSSNVEENIGWEDYTELIAFTNKSFTPQYTSHMGSYVVDRLETSEPDNSYATITLTPPTGKNRNYIVYVMIAGALIVLAGGVVLIKKFVI